METSMRKRMNLKGKKFGRLLVIKRCKEHVTESGYISPRWKCICDCGNTKIIRQQRLVNGTTKSCGCLHLEWAKKHGSQLNLIVDEKQYILDRIEINKKTECWEWTGTCFFNGYARAFLSSRKGKKYSQHANRMSYEVFIGNIPKNMMVCHKCDNPKCVNPEHLFLGSHKDNMADMVKKKRSVSGNRHPNSKLKEKDIIKIRKSKESKLFLAEKYGVSICTIRDVLVRRTWNNV